MAQSGWNFLKARWPALAQDCELADAQFARGEYDSCLRTTRRFGEMATWAIYKLKGLPIPHRDTHFLLLLSAEAFRKAVPRTVGAALHFIRVRGNQSSHDSQNVDADNDVPDECAVALRYMRRVARWMHAEWGGDPAEGPPPLTRLASDAAPAEGPPAVPQSAPKAVAQPPVQPAEPVAKAAGHADVEFVLRAFVAARVDASGRAPRAVAPGDSLDADLDVAAPLEDLCLMPGAHAFSMALRPATIASKEGAAIDVADAGGVIALANTDKISLSGAWLRGGPLAVLSGTLELVECRCDCAVFVGGESAALRVVETRFDEASIHVARQAHAMIIASRLTGGGVVASGAAHVILEGTSVRGAGGAALLAIGASIEAEACTLASSRVGAEARGDSMIELTACVLEGNATDILEGVPGSISR